MKTNKSRRKFLSEAATASVSVAALASPVRAESARVESLQESRPPAASTLQRGTPPISVSSGNGLAAVNKAVEVMRAGGDTLDAVIAGVNIVELDPKDNSVGYGGLPNERGDVELDASVMHGPTRRAGAVASIRGVREPSKVARVVLERTDHILIVGQGAREFATAHGFEDTNLLTEESRLAWLRWKETLSPVDKWGPSPYPPAPASPAGQKRLAQNANGRASYMLAESIARGDARRREELLAWADEVAQRPPTGTINCLALDAANDISGVTTTSGLAWKIPGRVGDSPLVGCGLYVDNDTGAAGSTGRGEEVIYINGARSVVEYMRRGMSPEQACLEALKLIAARYGNDREKLKDIDVNFYALNKRGEFAGAAIWNGSMNSRGELRRRQYAAHNGREGRLFESAYLFERRA
ncbi:MAG TPA: N(4)-(beta-N-acetylglucosaminyl)-L-asparaginase [Pyrinomonadaceae bacterium]|nr:N(4)-(beta-N-acetylglucosaminyl)-L-asparaginase [Pyrinomonadaceae bacterium]